MKKAITIILAAALILGLAACGKSELKYEGRSPIAPDEGGSEPSVSMKVKDGTLTDKGAVIVVTNDSQKRYFFGVAYYLEAKKGGEWYRIEPKEPLTFIAIAYYLDDGMTEESEIDWSFGYGKLPKGEYRIVKEFFEDLEPDEGMTDPEYKTISVTAGFTIEK